MKNMPKHSRDKMKTVGNGEKNHFMAKIIPRRLNKKIKKNI